VKRWLESRWYRAPPAPLLLRPLGWLYGLIADAIATRRKARAVKLPVPVIVVGNIAVGGTGKTPLVLWLIEELRALGQRPGVISRGYGGRAPHYPLLVDATTDPRLCGDEPALIARRAGVPLAVAPDRLAAGRLLIEQADVTILIADDGLQHYRLQRDLELCVVDGTRGLGNGSRLPAGPLREAPSRLDDVDLVVINGTQRVPLDTLTPRVTMKLDATEALPLAGGKPWPLDDLAGSTVHAVAGIGNPARFFATLRKHGLEVIEHPFPDHHAYTVEDLRFGHERPLLMTEKDAVKCAAFAQADWWWVPVQARLEPADAARVRELLLRFPVKANG
jgi:tetraacyldisaccharide 4'-kinase